MPHTQPAGPQRYLDFDLDVRPDGSAGYTVTGGWGSGRAPRECSHSPLIVPALHKAVDDFDRTMHVDLTRDLDPTGAAALGLPDDRLVQSVGEALFKAVFTGEVFGLFRQAQAQARQDRTVWLRVKLNVAPEFAGLPWEYLWDRSLEEYLSLSYGTSLVRSPEVPLQAAPVEVTGPLRVLGMVADPHDLQPLDADQERARMEAALAELRERGHIHLEWVGQPTWGDLRDALRNGPWHVFHFIGHGAYEQRTGQGTIALSGEDGRARPLPAEDLARLTRISPDLRLAVLNTCEGTRGSDRSMSSSVAGRLVRGNVPIVVGMQHKISDKAAIAFCGDFYDTVATGGSVDEAVLFARLRVRERLGETLEWGTPVLYSRSPEGRLFRVPEEQRSVSHPPAADRVATIEVPTRRTNVPARPLTTLIAREGDVLAVRGLLLQETSSLVTLIGPAGVGKTRLARGVVDGLLDHFDDGVWLVRLEDLPHGGLAAADAGTLVLSAISRALGLEETGTLGPAARLVEHLADKRSLLWLDAFERVVPAAGRVNDVLQACAQVKVLTTSRDLLGVDGEQRYAVEPLAVPVLDPLPELPDLAVVPSVRLFVERMRSKRYDFALKEENAADVAAVCVRVGGLPRAIELVIKNGPGDTRQLREQVPHVLGEVTRAIDWSFARLSTGEQTLLQRLAVFKGNCTFEAIERICAHGPERGQVAVLSGMNALIDRSLLQVRQQYDLYWMMATTRDYALDRLRDSGELDAVQRQHAEHYCLLAEQEWPRSESKEQAASLVRLDEQYDNLRAALEWSLSAAGDVETGLRLAGALGAYWYVRGAFTEGRAWLEKLLDRSAGSDTAVVAHAKNMASVLVLHQGDLALARRLAREALTHFEGLDSAAPEHAGPTSRTQGIARSYSVLAFIEKEDEDYSLARHYDVESLEHWRESGYAWGIAWVACDLALVLIGLGDVDEAERLLDESLRLREELEDQRGMTLGLLYLAFVRSRQGRRPHAVQLTATSLSLATQIGYQRGRALASYYAALLHHVQDEHEQARVQLELNLRLRRQQADERGAAECLELMACVARKQGRLEQARTLLRHADSLWTRLGARRIHREYDDLYPTVDEDLRRLREEAPDVVGAWHPQLSLAAIVAAALADPATADPSAATRG